MANWSIYRIQQPTEGIAGLNCIVPEQPTRVTLYDSDTGNYETIDTCFDPTTGNLCTLPSQLKNAGYHPNDWSTECP